MESRDLFDPQFNQLHHQRTFDSHIDCSCTFTHYLQDIDYQLSLYCTQIIGTQHQSSFQGPRKLRNSLSRFKAMVSALIARRWVRPQNK